MLLHQLPQPVVRAMHAHLERGHRRARDPCDLLVRQSFHVLQHEDLALLRGQVLQRPLQCARALHLLVRAVRPVGRRKHLVRRIERPFLSLPASPLRVAAVPQDQEQPPRKLVRLAAVRQPIERPYQRILYRILGDVPGAEHARRVARVAIAVAPLLDGVARREADALRALYQRHGESLYALAYGMLVDPGDAEEVVSETFAHLWRTAARFVATTNQSVSACLKEIARSRARGLLLAREWPERPSTPPRQGPLITMIEEVV